MAKTKIEYCEFTWNPVTGCTKGCWYCWARTYANRLEKAWGYDFTPTFHLKRVKKHRKWKPGEVVFVSDMGDLFDPNMPHMHIIKIFNVMWDYKKVRFLVLTKQPARMVDFAIMYVKTTGLWPANIYPGVSCTCQKEADKDVPELLKLCKYGARPWISLEPLLGPVEIAEYLPQFCAIHHKYNCCTRRRGREEPALKGVVLGGMTGPRAKPMHPDWVRKVRDDCKTAGIPFFFKSWGRWRPCERIGATAFAAPDNARTEMLAPDGSSVYLEGRPDVAVMARVGKKAAGRLLDGEEHNRLLWR